MSQCRSCKARIVWAKTTHGKNIPLDADPVESGNISLHDGVATVVVDGDGDYVSHFATCPDAGNHRRR